MPVESARRSLGRRIGCGAALLLPLVYYAAQAVLRTPPTGKASVIAHRGGAATAPENTMAAFRKAVAQKADAIELDVQMTKDGVPVVIHDETVDRTTNGSGAVRDMTLEMIRALDAGEGEQVPTFEEVVALAKSAGVRIVPEAKSPQLYPGVEAKILQVLRDADYLDYTVIQSFNASTLRRFRALDPDAALCALYGLWGFDISSPPGEAGYVCPMAEMVLLYPGMIRQAHREGRQVFVWFAATESPVAIKLLRFFGADGFIVNDPAAARRALEK